MDMKDPLCERMNRLVEEDVELFFHIYDEGRAAKATEGQKFAALVADLGVVFAEIGLFAAYHILVWAWRML